MSYVIYFGLAAVCGYLAARADRTNKKLYVWLIIALLSVVAGIRSATVGIDTISYLEKFDAIQYNRFDLAYGIERPFKYLVWLLQRLVPRGWFVLMALALLTHGCIISRFWMMRKTSWFPCMVVCYYMAHYFPSLNVMRQYCALAIVFYAVRFLEEKKIWKYIVAIIPAMLIHKSAVAGMLFLVFYFAHWNDLPENHKRLCKFGVKLLPLFGVALALLIVFGNYLKYFTNIQFDFGRMLPLKLCFLLVTLAVAFRGFRKSDFFQIPFVERFTMVAAAVFYMLSLLLGMMGYVFLEFDRIALYFTLFEAVYFGILLKHTKKWHRLIAVCFIVFVIGYAFIYSLTNNSYGQMPYRITDEIIRIEGYDPIGGNFELSGKPKPESAVPKNGIVREKGVRYYYENDRRVYAGLVIIEDNYYYVRRNGALVTDYSYFAEKTNGLLPKGLYRFNTRGQIAKFVVSPPEGCVRKPMIEENWK